MHLYIYIHRIIATCIITLFLSTATVSAEGVRGRLDGYGQYGAFPVSRMAVTLFSQSRGRTSASYSDYQGMFYIYNVAPGPHILEVWAGGNQPMTFNIMVIPNQPVTDIAPIRVR